MGAAAQHARLPRPPARLSVGGCRIPHRSGARRATPPVCVAALGAASFLALCALS